MTNFNFRYFAIFIAMSGALLFLGNSSGPAANNNFFTGAPSAGGGTESTCSTCHNNGGFGEPVLNVTFASGDSTLSVLEYVPGQTYQVTVAVGYGGTAPSGYGFSSQFLKDATPAGTPANPGDGVRISNGPAGSERRYIEHSARSVDSTFTFDWTAPEAGTGEVDYYVTGNLVNAAQGTGGDNGSTSPTIITLTEGVASSVRYFTSIPHALYPNPTLGASTLRITPATSGDYMLELRSIDGRFVRTATHRLTAGLTEIAVPSQNLPAGVYAVQLTGEGSRLVSRLVVR